MEKMHNAENDREIKNKYASMLIGNVWKRLAKEGIENADEIIGTRETIENIDFEKFWNNVAEDDIQGLIDDYTKQKEQALDEFKKFKGEFDPTSGQFTSSDTSFWDNNISELEELKKSLLK